MRFNEDSGTVASFASRLWIREASFFSSVAKHALCAPFWEWFTFVSFTASGMNGEASQNIARNTCLALVFRIR